MWVLSDSALCLVGILYLSPTLSNRDSLRTLALDQGRTLSLGAPSQGMKVHFLPFLSTAAFALHRFKKLPQEAPSAPASCQEEPVQSLTEPVKFTCKRRNEHNSWRQRPTGTLPHRKVRRYAADPACDLPPLSEGGLGGYVESTSAS